ncbi:MAG: bifunctional nuclease family protein [Dehalococcoidia bacterium]|nr:bifunctional nuclease family protein [Dehalococcoidia bacterium]MDW8119427.1 bifunctional nuclease family protein [Chloroflexota bacterium]
MQEMVIDSIRVSLMNYQRVVILKEKGADRYLPIWIGPAEADSIAIKLQDVQVPRPLTHDLLRNIIYALGARVAYIVVNDLKDDTFYAKIVLEVDGKSLDIDARPSDAIAIAVRVNAPIYAEESVLEKAGIPGTKEGEAEGEVRSKGEKVEKVTEEEMRKLGAFKEFIEGLNLEDLGKGKTS